MSVSDTIEVSKNSRRDSMEQRDFLEKEAIRTPEKELEVRAVFAENAALKEENAELKERLAYL